MKLNVVDDDVWRERERERELKRGFNLCLEGK